MVVMEAASSSPSAPWRTEPRRLGKSTARELRRFTALGTRAPAAGSSAVSEAVEARRLKVFVLSLVGGRRRREEAGKEEVGRKVLVGGGKEEKERGSSSKEEEGGGRREYLHLTEMASSSCRLGQEGRLSSCN